MVLGLRWHALTPSCVPGGQGQWSAVARLVGTERCACPAAPPVHHLSPRTSLSHSLLTACLAVGFVAPPSPPLLHPQMLLPIKVVLYLIDAVVSGLLYRRIGMYSALPPALLHGVLRNAVGVLLSALMEVRSRRYYVEHRLGLRGHAAKLKAKAE